MSDVQVEITWHTRHVQAQLAKAVNSFIQEAALIVVKHAQANAPVRGRYRSFKPGWQVDKGGTLRASIIVDMSQGGNSQGIASAVVQSTCGYGLFVHNGTFKMGARPFLTEGVMQARPEILNAAENILKG